MRTAPAHCSHGCGNTRHHFSPATAHSNLQLELPSNPLDSLIDQLGGPSQVRPFGPAKLPSATCDTAGSGTVHARR